MPERSNLSLLGNLLVKVRNSVFFRERRCPSCSAPFMPRSGQNASSGEAGEEIAFSIFCPECAAQLARRKTGCCPQCGNPHLSEDLPNSPCGNCLKSPPPWSGVVFQSAHQGLLRELILRLKYKGEIILARHLGHLLSGHSALEHSGADVIIPIPLHPSRLGLRGFNQALEIAGPIAKKLDVPLEYKLMSRIRATIPQPGLSFEQRHVNIKNAFAVTGNVEGARILLVDDVMTSGATMNSAATTLLDAGAAEVTLCLLSRKSML